MPLALIIEYCLDAAAFALPVGLLFLLFRWLTGRKRNFNWKREGLYTLFVTYLAALLKITAIRQAGLADFSLFHGSDSLMLIPLQTTWKELKKGLWPFLYHAVGNTVWFVPLGAFLRALRNKSWQDSLRVGLCLSLLIELTQWLLQSGISDVDDLLFNSLGSLLGWLLWPCALALWSKLCYSKRKNENE